MPNPRLAKRYAKSLVDLAIEKGELESVNKDVRYVNELINKVPEVKVILNSPVIKPDKKVAILRAATAGVTGPISQGFFQLLLNKSRENVLPEIVTAFIDQYDSIKGINKVKITTPQPISEAQKQMVISKLEKEAGLQNIQLQTKIDESLIGGFVLEYNNNVVDASLKYDLQNIKKRFMRNDYIFNIR